MNVKLLTFLVRQALETIGEDLAAARLRRLATQRLRELEVRT